MSEHEYPNPRLRAHVREHAENRPGVYRMLGRDGEVLYVGKSIRLRTRLLSYFRAQPGEKGRRLVREAQALEWEYVPDEFGALVREMRQIQRWRPRYNVQHKRRREYAFVKITCEPAPRVLAVRRVVPDGSVYYGPFPAVTRTARTIRALGQALGLRDCPAATPIHFADQLEIFREPRTPGCIRADLGSCLAPCCARCTSVDYQARVEAAHRFLEGWGDAPLEILERAMREAARRLDFEYASILRDRLERLRIFREELIAFRGRIESLSFVYPGRGEDGPGRLYLIRTGRVLDEIDPPESRAEWIRARRAVGEVFSGAATAPGALRSEEAAEILLVAKWFQRNPEERARAIPADRWLDQITSSPDSAPESYRTRPSRQAARRASAV